VSFLVAGGKHGNADKEWLMGEIVTCANLVKIYKVADLEVQALQGLELRVAAGEMVALVGASGSGKSTLLNILSGFDEPTAGACQVAGFDLTRITAAQLLRYRRTIVGHLWQQSGRNLVPEYSIEQNVTLPLLARGVNDRARHRRSRELLDMVGLQDLGARRPGEISGGQQQRASIAVALANSPTVLLADEPTGELDSETAHGIMQTLHALNRQLGLTVILVTHDPLIASEAERIIAIRNGRTSAESVRQSGGTDLAGGAAAAMPGLSSATHRDYLLLDQAGRLQVPPILIERLRFGGRVEMRDAGDHLEIWPTDDDSMPEGRRTR